MKEYQTPKLEEIKIAVEDVLYTSVGEDFILSTELLGLTDN